MNNILILIISLVILVIIFLVVLIIISKNKINEELTAIEIANDDINNSLKQKYTLFKEIVTFLKDNLSIKEDAFQDFTNFNKNECAKGNLINILDKTTYEINDYVNKYNDSLKNKDFLELKRKLYRVEINLEAIIEYYNNKLNTYNDLKTHAPTSIASKLFDFPEYKETNINKKEISRLINLS